MDARLQAIVFDWLDQTPAAEILGVGAGAKELLQAYTAHGGGSFVIRDAGEILGDSSRLRASNCAIVAGAIEALPKREAENLLARIRDTLSQRVCVIVWREIFHRDQPECWNLADFSALGFRSLSAPGSSEHDPRLFSYDLNSYKPTHDWLNPKNWANPELWDKFRW